MAIVTASTFDGNNINDGTLYRARLALDESDAPDGAPITADVDFGYPYFIDHKRVSKRMTLFIDMVGATTAALYETRRNEIVKWFNPHRGGERYLVATWTNSPTSRRIACVPLSIRFVSKVAQIELEALTPIWENNTLTQTAWAFTTSGASGTVVNQGNVPVAPVLRFRKTAAGTANLWPFKRKSLVSNNCAFTLKNYPLDVTGGGWDTAAIVKVAANYTTLSGTVTAAATQIPVAAAGSLIATRGYAYIGTEQIFYSGVAGGTALTGCIRGVNSTTEAAYASGGTIWRSQMAADGRDVRVVLDDVEIPHWFGGTIGDTYGPNAASSRVWAVIPEIPAHDATYDTGYLVTNGTNLALGCTATATATKPGFSALQLTDGTPLGGQYGGWRTNDRDKDATVIVDLGSSMNINRVRIRLHPVSDHCPDEYTIQTSTDGNSYTTRVTQSSDPTGANTTYDRWVTHDFADVAARYVKLDITSVVGGAGWYIHIMQIEVYNAKSRLNLKYGNVDAGAMNQNDDTKPLFNLTTSTNTSWDYDDFYDERYPNRAKAWTPVIYQTGSSYLNRQRKYNGEQGSVGTHPAAVLGVASKRTSTKVFRDGHRLSGLTGCTQVVHAGYTKQNPNYRTWNLLTLNANGQPEEIEYTNSDNSPSTWKAFSQTVTCSPTAYGLIYYQRQVANTTAEYYGETTDATLTLTNTPTVTFAAAVDTQSVEATLYNSTRDETIYIRGMIPIDTDYDIDCEAFTVTDVLAGIEYPAMVQMEGGTVRERWMELSAGTNIFTYTEAGLGGGSIQFRFRDTWL